MPMPNHSISSSSSSKKRRRRMLAPLSMLLLLLLLVCNMIQPPPTAVNAFLTPQRTRTTITTTTRTTTPTATSFLPRQQQQHHYRRRSGVPFSISSSNSGVLSLSLAMMDVTDALSNVVSTVGMAAIGLVVVSSILNQEIKNGGDATRMKSLTGINDENENDNGDDYNDRTRRRQQQRQPFLQFQPQPPKEMPPLQLFLEDSVKDNSSFNEKIRTNNSNVAVMEEKVFVMSSSSSSLLSSQAQDASLGMEKLPTTATIASTATTTLEPPPLSPSPPSSSSLPELQQEEKSVEFMQDLEEDDDDDDDDLYFDDNEDINMNDEYENEYDDDDDDDDVATNAITGVPYVSDSLIDVVVNDSKIYQEEDIIIVDPLMLEEADDDEYDVYVKNNEEEYDDDDDDFEQNEFLFGGGYYATDDESGNGSSSPMVWGQSYEETSMLDEFEVDEEEELIAMSEDSSVPVTADASMSNSDNLNVKTMDVKEELLLLQQEQEQLAAAEEFDDLLVESLMPQDRIVMEDISGVPYVADSLIDMVTQDDLVAIEEDITSVDPISFPEEEDEELLAAPTVAVDDDVRVEDEAAAGIMQEDPDMVENLAVLEELEAFNAVVKEEESLTVPMANMMVEPAVSEETAPVVNDVVAPLVSAQEEIVAEEPTVEPQIMEDEPAAPTGLKSPLSTPPAPFANQKVEEILQELQADALLDELPETTSADTKDITPVIPKTPAPFANQKVEDIIKEIQNDAMLDELDDKDTTPKRPTPPKSEPPSSDSQSLEEILKDLHEDATRKTKIRLNLLQESEESDERPVPAMMRSKDSTSQEEAYAPESITTYDDEEEESYMTMPTSQDQSFAEAIMSNEKKTLTMPPNKKRKLMRRPGAVLNKLKGKKRYVVGGAVAIAVARRVILAIIRQGLL